MHCLFCDVPCIVSVYMFTEQLPPGGYPIAVKYKYIYILILTACFGQVAVIRPAIQNSE